nr:NAD-binding protein [Halomarina sp. BND7]
MPTPAAVRQPRVAVFLTGVVAAVAVATGVLVLGLQVLLATEIPVPIVGAVPRGVSLTAAFTGTLTGFALLLSARGLRGGSRLAWYSAVALLPLVALLGVLQATPVSTPVVALSFAALALLVDTRAAFSRPTDLTPTQLAAIGAIVGSQLYGTVGAYLLREDFTGIETPIQAFYFSLVTASTVGYGDVAPTSDIARLFAVSAIILGTSSFAAAAGALLVPAVEARFERTLGTMTDKSLSLLERHVIVVGHGDLTEPILEELTDEDADFVVVTEDPDAAGVLRDRGLLVYVGDPSDEEPLRRVGIERARAVVAATEDDARDALVVLTARELNPDVRIVAAATDRENVKKLRRAGADTIISPAVIGGHLLVRSALGTGGMEALADRLLDVDDARDL